MAWLSGWAKRVKLTIDHNNIDEEQTGHHVRVHLSASSGPNNGDVSCVFDELESYNNRKKIALTKDDGVTQLYCEIEKWDHANEQAELWVTRDGWAWSPDADTDFYLYYDKTKADNTDYVGDPGSTPAEAVWDEHFMFVCHMRNDPDATHVRDSTSHHNHGTKLAADNPTEVDGPIGKGQDFVGVMDYINCGSDPSILLDVFTAEFVGKTTEVDFNPVISFASTYPLIALPWYTSRPIIYLGGSNYRYFLAAPVNVLDGQFHHLAYIVVGNEQFDILNSKMLADGQVQNISSTSSGGLPRAKDRLWIGSTYRNLTDIIDEVRLSDIVRTDAWIKASSESDKDHLLDFGSEEPGWRGTIAGVTNPAAIAGVPVAGIPSVKGVTSAT